MKRRRLTVLVLVCALIVSSLGAADLSSVLEQAKENSSRMQLIELQKAENDITIRLQDVPSKVGVGVSGTAGYQETTFKTGPNPLDTADYWTLSASPSITIALPNEDTEITVGVSQITKALNVAGYWQASPTVGFSHTFSFGDDGDNLSDLSYARKQLEFDYAYRTGIADFENQIYTKSMEIIGYEQDLLEQQKALLVAQTQFDQAVKLRTVTEGSAAYRSLQVAVASQERATVATEKQLALAKLQFEQYTGIPWEQLDSIPTADLNFSVLSTGDATVLLAAMDLEIAREELALAQRRSVAGAVRDTVPSLKVLTNAGLNYMDTYQKTVGYELSAGAQYTGGNFSTSAQVDMDISQTGNITPSVTISGSWQNKRTAEVDQLEMQSLKYDVTLAEMDYQMAMQDYQLKGDTLQSDILNHQLAVSAFSQHLDYVQEELRQTEAAFARGLVTETEVHDAELAVALAEYDQKIFALQALLLENRIEALQW
jgi:hypothetical protein